MPSGQRRTYSAAHEASKEREHVVGYEAIGVGVEQEQHDLVERVLVLAAEEARDEANERGREKLALGAPAQRIVHSLEA